MDTSALGGALATALLARLGARDLQSTLAELVVDIPILPGNKGNFALLKLLDDVVQCASASDDEFELVNASFVQELRRKLIKSALAMTQRCDEVTALDMEPIVKLCTERLDVMEAVVSACQMCLRTEIQRQSKTPDQFVVTSTAIDLSYASKCAASDDVDVVQYELSVRQCLLLVRSLAWRGGGHFEPFVLPLGLHLLVLVGLESSALLTGSKDAILALLPQLERCGQLPLIRNSSGYLITFSAYLWSRIMDLTSFDSLGAHVTVGLSIWSRLLSILTNGSLLLSSIHSSEYWARLQSRLASGTFEQRKICLYILSMSLSHISQDLACPCMTFRLSKSETYQGQYAKFVTLFRTIVLDRYLNQVQDCLPDLLLISVRDSYVHASWVATLLHAGLSHGMQDSIRGLIGDWTLSNAVQVLARSRVGVVEFVRHAFLEWATLGYHYTSSIKRGPNGSLVCTHGEKVSDFLYRILLSTNDASTLAYAILSFIANKGGRIFSFSRAFVLDGLLRSIRSGNVVLCRQHLERVAEIGSAQGFQEIVGDLMIFQCAALWESAANDIQEACNIKAILEARKTILASKKDVEESTAKGASRFNEVNIGICRTDTIGSVHRFQQVIQATQHRCLWGEGLQAGCDYIIQALNSSEERTILPGDLNVALLAIWDETETQDYPRQVVMSLPRVVFHKRCLQACIPETDLHFTLLKLATELQRLAETRVYVFAPFSRAIRKAFLECPEAVRLPFTNLIIRYANKPPSAMVEFRLEDVMASKLVAFDASKNYEAYYGLREGYGHASMVNIVNQLPATDYWQTQCQHVVDVLMQPWLNQKEPVPVFSPWKTSMQLQLTLILAERIVPHLPSGKTEEHLHRFLKILSIEPLPRYRYLLEWIIARIAVHNSLVRTALLGMFSYMDVSNPKHCVSLIKITQMVAYFPGSDEVFAIEVMAKLVTLAASQKVAIRHEAQWTFPMLWSRAEKEGWSKITENPAFNRLNDHVKSLDTYKRPPPGRLLEKLDPVNDHSLAQLFQGTYLRIEPSEAEIVSHEDFKRVYEESGASDRVEMMPLGKTRKSPQDEAKDTQSENDRDSLTGRNTLVPLQTKNSAWPGDEGAREGGISRDRERDTDIIVVASFVESPYNLGGLSRAGEIFGIRSLQVKDANVVKSKDFTSVSVSSHLWLAIEELDPDAVPAFLIDKKMEGYNVVGIEQTDSSRVLGSDEFLLPGKLVLVLGGEKEGIPARVLVDLDFCVEIEQVGRTRSLNVQTAAAMVLYEHSRQQRRR